MMRYEKFLKWAVRNSGLVGLLIVLPVIVFFSSFSRPHPSRPSSGQRSMISLQPRSMLKKYNFVA